MIHEEPGRQSLFARLYNETAAPTPHVVTRVVRHLERVDIGAVYQNRKNKELYKVQALGIDTELPDRPMVYYVPLYLPESGVTDFFRPLDLFKQKFRPKPHYTREERRRGVIVCDVCQEEQIGGTVTLAILPHGHFEIDRTICDECNGIKEEEV